MAYNRWQRGVCVGAFAVLLILMLGGCHTETAEPAPTGITPPVGSADIPLEEGDNPASLPEGGGVAMPEGVTPTPTPTPTPSPTYEFNPPRVPDGGLADAVSHQLSTGEPVGGKSYLIKASERVKNLENIIKHQKLSQSDLIVANSLLNDLRDALAGS
jgi:hypothetical protein